jgi:Na+-transporting methylmalonyl-CoA/oxaloacetate decarboxylase gamma subunit
MRRHRTDEERSVGQDSFLDVVTNIVGILIILVMVIGARVRQLVLEPREPETTPAVAALERDVAELAATVASAEQEIEGLELQVEAVELEVTAATHARLELATAVSAATVGLSRIKDEADAARVEAAERDARRRRLEVEIRQCRLETEGIAHAAATTEEVLAYPTPIGRTVNGDEIHFRLAGGRIAYVPLEELFEMAKAHTRRNSASLSNLTARIVTVGPARGFNLDYVVEAKIDRSRGQVLIRSREWVVRPVDLAAGETFPEALEPRSGFRRVLTGVRPDTTVTLWCYPDSFDGYRQVRAELHRLGIPTAGRPLPEGAPIGGSTEGSKSVVQ